MDLTQTSTTRWQILKDATLFFSRSTPNLAIVIPAMDKIDRRFNDILKKSTIDNSIKSAVHLALATLNRYYSLTDASEVYWIAMSTSYLTFSLVLELTQALVLHPHHKLRYFKTQQWQAEWIVTAEELLQTEFNHLYASEIECVDVTASASDDTTAPVCQDSLFLMYLTDCLARILLSTSLIQFLP